MPIVDYRIDDRLIHGQVCSFWINVLSANKILIVDDEIAKDSVRTMALKLGCPNSCGLVIKGVKDAAALLKRYNGVSKLFIIVNNPKKYLDLINEGIEIPYITVGNMARVKDSEPIQNTVFVTQKDMEVFKELKDKKVKLYTQMVPDDPRVDITSKF